MGLRPPSTGFVGSDPITTDRAQASQTCTATTPEEG
jgi:hypothetical protein